MFSKVKRKTSEQTEIDRAKTVKEKFNRKASEDKTLFDNKSSVTLLAGVNEKSFRKSYLLEKVIPSFFVSSPGFTREDGFTYTKTQKCN